MRSVLPIFLFGLLLCLGCTSINRTQAKENLLTRFDEEGHIVDYLVQDFSFETKSSMFLLSALQYEWSSAVTNRRLEICLYERDMRPSARPRQIVVSGSVLESARMQPDSKLASGKHTVSFSSVMFLDIIGYLAEFMGSYSMDTYSDPAVLKLSLGPPELVGKTWCRKVCRVPPGLREAMLGLPDALHPYEESIAYDRNANVLNVVAPNASSIWVLIKALGLEVITGIGTSPKAPIKTVGE